MNEYLNKYRSEINQLNQAKATCTTAFLALERAITPEVRRLKREKNVRQLELMMEAMPEDFLIRAGMEDAINIASCDHKNVNEKGCADCGAVLIDGNWV